MRRVTVAIAACTLLAVPSAVAKDFGPGDIAVCGRSHCEPIVDKRLLRILSAYYWGPRKVVRAAPVRVGARGFALRWRNGYTSAVVGGATLGRFRAQGFYCGRFVRGRWYRFPAEAAAAMKKLTAGVRPLRVTACVRRLSSASSTLTRRGATESSRCESSSTSMERQASTSSA
jgi:hypothetical protein